MTACFDILRAAMFVVAMQIVARSAETREAITQYELADYLNTAFDTDLSYTPMTVEEYREDRVAELGEFLGTVITGIYQGIRDGEADNPSHYLEAAGREHVSWPSYFASLGDQEATGPF